MVGPVRFNSVNFMLAGGKKTAGDLKLQEHIVKNYGERKAITELVNAVMEKLAHHQPYNLQIHRDNYTGKLDWSLDNTAVDLNITPAPSFFARLKHDLKMFFSSDYAQIFNNAVGAVVATYTAFQHIETAAPAAAAKAAADLAAVSAAKQKQAEIDTLNVQIPEKQVAIEALQGKRQLEEDKRQSFIGELATLKAKADKLTASLAEKKAYLRILKCIHLEIPRYENVADSGLLGKLSTGVGGLSSEQIKRLRRQFANAARGRDPLKPKVKISDQPASEEREKILKSIEVRIKKTETSKNTRLEQVQAKETQIAVVDEIIAANDNEINLLTREKSDLEAAIALLQASPVVIPPPLAIAAPTLAKLEAKFVATLSRTEGQLRNTLIKPSDEIEEMPSSLANFILGLVKGKDGILITINPYEYHFAGMTPYEATIDFGDLLKGVIAMNQSLTLKYSNGRWVLGGDIQFINESGKKFKLDGMRLKGNAQGMTMKLDSRKQSFWNRSYFAGMKPIANDEVNQRVFNPNFLV